MKNRLVIETLTAFVSVDEAGNEGILAIKIGTTFMPLVAADEDRLKSMHPMARAISKDTGMPYRILRFATRWDVTEDYK